MTNQATRKPWRERVLEAHYTGKPGWIDGTRLFHEFIAKHSTRRDAALELGPGPENTTSILLRRLFTTFDGLDVDPAIRENKSLQQAYVYEGGAWPVPDARYDAIVADFVLEHVDDPGLMAREAFRALRPGGAFIFRTPNMWHYVTLGSRLTPHWIHVELAKRLKGNTPDMHDAYPTFYRANTRGAVRKWFGAAGFEEAGVMMVEKEPSYGVRSPLLFYPFMAYERVVNATEALAFARVNIFGAFRKPG